MKLDVTYASCIGKPPEYLIYRVSGTPKKASLPYMQGAVSRVESKGK